MITAAFSILFEAEIRLSSLLKMTSMGYVLRLACLACIAGCTHGDGVSTKNGVDGS